jgi:GNAT superfamily N-acetyltransferase
MIRPVTRVEAVIRPWGGEDEELAALADWPVVAHVDLDRLRQARSVADRRIEAAWLGKRLAGVAVADLAGDGFCEITLAVRPDRRRQGIGSLLLDHLRRSLPAARLMAIVAHDNAPAIAFFSRHEFRRQPSASPGFVRFLGEPAEDRSRLA